MTEICYLLDSNALVSMTPAQRSPASIRKFTALGSDRRVDAGKCLSTRGNVGLRRLKNPEIEGTPLVKATSWSSGLVVSGDGVGVVAHAGSIALRLS